MTQRPPGPADPSGAEPVGGAWGARRPGLLFLALVQASQAIPQAPVVKQLAFLIRRLARRLVEDPVDVVHWGHRLRLLTRGNISEATFLFMPHRWDPAERALLARELGPGAVFVDVGANAGGYVWWLLHRMGDAFQCLAVEPDPALHQRLRFNLATNGVRNVEVVQAAVGAESGEGWLRLDPGNLGQNVLVQEADGRAGVRVPIRTLQELVEAAGLPRIDALKIDVEGLEAAILNAFYDRAPEALWPRLLVVERQPTPEHRALVDRLQDLGYREALATRMNLVLRREP